MRPLEKHLRNRLERTIKDARDIAEAAARAALEQLGVGEAKPYPHLQKSERELRRRLRVHGRQLGDVFLPSPSGRGAGGEGRVQEIDRLVEEVAYEHWHRMLFARFLAENSLLMYPDPDNPVAVTLEECEDLAADEGAADGWELAARFATRMLPHIFRPDSPVFQLALPPEHQQTLERLVAELPREVFTASDSLGWVYQFWQSKKKDEVNASEVKIGAKELPAVTQLFTEHYMVAFLLDNTLGAWWAARCLNESDLKNARSEDELRNKAALPGMPLEYLRFVRSYPSPSTGEGRGEGDGPWRPAAGTFDGWPENLAEFKLLDPCCGSGHFLVAAFLMLIAMRMELEGLSAEEAVDAVLRDNLHGLEIDERCCQIAAFALAFAAWTYAPSPSTGEGRGEGESPGYRPLPDLHIACTGIGPQSTKEQWLRLAEEAAARGGMPVKRDLFRTEESLLSAPVKASLELLYELFAQAPILGSLINPVDLPSDLFHADYRALAPLLSAILSAEKADDETRERAIAAAGMCKAVDLLSGKYTLVITNVPYLVMKRMGTVLRSFCATFYGAGKMDLATVFLMRFRQALGSAGVLALVMPQNWLFLGSYESLRTQLLRGCSWLALARLGPGAFETISGEVVKAVLVVITDVAPSKSEAFTALDVASLRDPAQKADGLQRLSCISIDQSAQLRNPDARITFGQSTHETLLSEHAISMRGIVSGDGDRWMRQFWEVNLVTLPWRLLQSTVDRTVLYGGREQIIDWATSGQGMLRPGTNNLAYGNHGLALGQIGDLPCTIYTGELYDNNTGVIVPNDSSQLTALWAFCSSPEYVQAVRRIDQKLNVTSATLIKVPFELAHWQKVAEEKYPNGLPEPESDDPTQWLFHGFPGGKVEAASSRLQDQRQDVASALFAFGYLDREAEIDILSGNLPHWRQEGVTYFVTFRTDDSIPQEKLRQWQSEREAWLTAHPLPHDEATRRQYGKLFPGRIHEWLDASYGACALARLECHQIVEGAVRHFNGQRYSLDEFVVMPNHVHVIVTPMAGHELSDILHSWKSYTSKQINKVIGQSGTFWQKESFDHILRSVEQLEKVRQYIRENPKGKVEAASRRLPDTRQDAASTLQVAVARLMGYQWPAELDEKMRLSKRARELVKRCDELCPFADKDGIVCIPPVRGESSAADRLLNLLAKAYGKDWSTDVLSALIKDAGFAGKSLEIWLRDGFFPQHCDLFHQRPFIWQIWDGLRDGFSVLVNYHKLDRKNLETLIYTYLGDWIRRQKDDIASGVDGAQERLAAAETLKKRLELILQGEAPYDIFVRWKPIEKQPIGWEPDINDGVRLNIRPFLSVPDVKTKGAGVLRVKPKIKWDKDRGKDVPSAPWYHLFKGDRINDYHLRIEEKLAARKGNGGP